MKVSVKLALIVVMPLFFISTSGYAGQMMSAQFRTMSTCLSAIKKNSAAKMKVVTDKPHEVSGVLSNGQFFSCTKKESGTKGTYFEGNFTVD